MSVQVKFKYFGIFLSAITLISINISSTKVLAQEPRIEFGEAISLGTCTFGEPFVGEDGTTYAIALDGFASENGKRERCILRINTTIPNGFYADLQFFYQGSTEVFGEENATLSRSYTFTGGATGIAKAAPKTTQFTTSEGLFQERDKFIVGSCGGLGQLGINIIASSSSKALLVVDDLKIHVDLVPCS
ncbi:MAG: hypothetical protein RLZZ499_2527 [Cyanobacteriota bacterium]